MRLRYNRKFTALRHALGELQRSINQVPWPFPGEPTEDEDEDSPESVSTEQQATALRKAREHMAELREALSDARDEAQTLVNLLAQEAGNE